MLYKFNIGHCEIMVRVTIAPAKFNNFTFETSADGSKLNMIIKSLQRKNNVHVYTIRYVVGGRLHLV